MDSGFDVAIIVVTVALAVSLALAGVITTVVIRKMRQLVAWVVHIQYKDTGKPASVTTDTNTEKTTERNTTQSTAHNGAVTNQEKQDLWWVWPILGLLAGCVAAVVHRQQATAIQKLDPEVIGHRLLQAYNPLLMEVNALSLQPQSLDVVASTSQYTEHIRPLLYAQSHLLSAPIVKAAAELDECLSGNDHEKLATKLSTLQRLVRNDHERLSIQLGRCSGPNRNSGLSA